MNNAFFATLTLFEYTDTLRSIFDMHSFEYQSSTNDIRIRKLQRIQKSNIRLHEALKGRADA